MSSFMKKIQEKDKKSKEKLQERLGKEDTLYMGDPALQWATGGWVRGKANLVYGPSGCVDANTFIRYDVVSQDGERQNNKGGTIEHLYKHFNKIKIDGSGAYQRKSTLDSTFAISSVDDDGFLVKNKILDVVKSGKKECFEVVTENGFKVITTLDHKFLSDGKFKELRELELGNIVSVYTRESITKIKKSRKKDYKELYVKFHPALNLKLVKDKSGTVYQYYRLSEHRAVIEANMNNLLLDEYIEILNSSSQEEILKLTFLSAGKIVHHKDENKRNNNLSNLVVLDKYEHDLLHYNETKPRRHTTTIDSIKEINPVGVRETYDIKCEAPYNNFLADDFVVHNCGKSTLALKGAAEEQRKTNGYVVIYDSEYSHHDPNETDSEGNLTAAAKSAKLRYMSCGLNTDKVIVRSSNEIDELFFGISDLEKDIRSGDLNVSSIVIDSWGGIQSETAKKKIEKGEIGAAGNQFGGNAKTMGPMLQELLRLSAENGVTMFFIQHCINNMDEYGPKYLLLGGQKLRFLVHMTLFMESVAAKDASLLEGGVATTKETVSSDIVYKIGKKIRFTCEKSRKVVEGRKGEFWFDFENCNFALPGTSLFNLATSLGVIDHPKNPELEIKGPNKGQPKLDKDGNAIVKENKMYWEYPAGAPGASKWHGQEGMKAALNSDSDLFNQIFQECMLSTKKAATSESMSKVDEVG